MYGREITRSKLYNETKTNIYTINNFRKDSAENDRIPSGAIPASIEIDPLVRHYASNSGMLVSENSIWMVTVATREYMKSVIEKTIANSEDFSEGYASQLPRSNMVLLACKQYEAKTEDSLVDSRSASAEAPNNICVIGNAELANMLESNPLIAGSLASSRMSWMRSAVSDGTNSSLRYLVKVERAINIAIQQGETKTIISSVNNAPEISNPLGTLNPNDLSTTVSQTHKNKGDGALAGSSNISSPENLSSKTSSAAVDEQSGVEHIGSPQYRPLAKAHFRVTSGPDVLPVNGHTTCDTADSKMIVSPPVSDTLNDSSNAR